MKIYVGETAERLLVRLPEAAAMIGLSRSMVYKLVASGELPVVRIHRAVRIPVSALRAWAEQQADKNAARTENAARTAGEQ